MEFEWEIPPLPMFSDHFDLRDAAVEMLQLEAYRMWARDIDPYAPDSPVPCPCPGCDALRFALRISMEDQKKWKATPVKK